VRADCAPEEIPPVGEFILTNWALVALFIASGVMLLWPELSNLAGGGTQISTLEATRLMNKGSTLVLDVRNGNEFATGHLPKARHIPMPELSKRIEEIGKFKDKPVIVTCGTGGRAGAASRFLKSAGFTTVYQLKGGLAAWQQASLPVEK
jgi:rhodanese-related sulfurtransferase